MPSFVPFPKLSRLSREIVITEKLDGTNSAVVIEQLPEERGGEVLLDGETAIVGRLVVSAQSRTRLITPGKSTDNFGFAGWVRANAEQLVNLGPGTHFGEWYGVGIQRNYGLTERRFALFNVHRWAQNGQLPEYDKQCIPPDCCEVVPILFRGDFETHMVHKVLLGLKRDGSRAVPGFMDPEGVVVFHTASGVLFKKTIKDDEVPKALALKKAA